MDSLKSYLNNIAPLTEIEWEESKQLFKREKYDKGDFLVKEGFKSNKIAFIEKGLFRLYYLIDGEEKTMLFFSEGQFVADYFSFITQTPSIRPVEALEDSIVFSISYKNLHKLYKYKNWETIGRIMAEKAYVYSVLEANRLLHDNFETRYVNFIKENPELNQRVPQYMIASYLKMSPETLSRIKKRIDTDSEYKSIHNITGLNLL